MTEPTLLVLEAPLAGLDASSAWHLLQVLGRVSSGRHVLLSSPVPTPGSVDEQLAQGADERVTLATDAPA